MCPANGHQWTFQSVTGRELMEGEKTQGEVAIPGNFASLPKNAGGSLQSPFLIFQIKNLVGPRVTIT